MLSDSIFDFIQPQFRALKIIKKDLRCYFITQYQTYKYSDEVKDEVNKQMEIIEAAINTLNDIQNKLDMGEIR